MRTSAGEFGEVCRGKLLINNKVVDVAVKRMREGSTDQFNFLREAHTMAQFSHPNVIRLEGVVTKSKEFVLTALNVFDQKNCNKRQ